MSSQINFSWFDLMSESEVYPVWVQARAKLPKKRRRVVNCAVAEARKNRRLHRRSDTMKQTLTRLGMGGGAGAGRTPSQVSHAIVVA